MGAQLRKFPGMTESKVTSDSGSEVIEAQENVFRDETGPMIGLDCFPGLRFLCMCHSTFSVTLDSGSAGCET